MENKTLKSPPPSDAKRYFVRFTGEREEFYRVFFRMCHKFGVSWSSATPKERLFIEAITRFTYEQEAAKRKGIPLNTVKPVFDLT